jgi:hypothetical protein
MNNSYQKIVGLTSVVAREKTTSESAKSVRIYMLLGRAYAAMEGMDFWSI